MKLSILIAAYNVENFIKRCVDSCIEQDLADTEYEIIVIDDQSKDATQKILNLFSQKNLHVFTNSENLGLGACRNIAIEKSSGKYLWFIDGDDYIEKNCLQNILHEIDENNLDILHINNYVVKNSGEKYTTSSDDRKSNNIVSGGEFFKNNFVKCYTWLYIIKSSIFKNHSIQFLPRINMQDSEILPKILLHTQRIKSINTPYYYYTQNENSFTNTNNFQKRYTYFVSIIEVKKSLEKQLTQSNNNQLNIGIQRKIESLNEIVFNHLLYYDYSKKNFSNVITLLKVNGLYPIFANKKGFQNMLNMGINRFPWSTKIMFDLLRHYKKM